MEKASYGTYALPPWANVLAKFCRTIPVNWLGQRLVFLLRKPVFWAGKSCVDANVGGASFRLFPRGNLSDKRLLCTPAMLDGKERRFFEKELPSSGWVIDAGANIGGYCLLLAASRSDLQFIAIEADIHLIERLQSNIHFSMMEERVKVENCAVTEEDGPVYLCRDNVNSGKNSVETCLANGADRNPEIQGYSLVSILNRNNILRPLAVKLDIEGHEYPVLQGFFKNAPTSRWPAYIQLEQYRNTELSRAAHLLIDKGYTPCLRSRMNIIFHRHFDDV